MDAEGVTVTPELMITQPRLMGQIGDAAEFPPASAPDYWPAEAERPFGEIVLPPTGSGGDGDVLVLMRAEVDGDVVHAYAKGYVVEGVEGGEPFRDVVETYTVFCRDGGHELTTACRTYTDEHGF